MTARRKAIEEPCRIPSSDDGCVVADAYGRAIGEVVLLSSGLWHAQAFGQDWVDGVHSKHASMSEAVAQVVSRARVEAPPLPMDEPNPFDLMHDAFFGNPPQRTVR